MNKVEASILVGVRVRTKKRIKFPGDIAIPKGCLGVILSADSKNVSVDFGPKHGAAQVYWRELRRA